MKLKFKYQQFQQDAVDSVCNVFSGQPFNDKSNYLVDPGKNTSNTIFSAGANDASRLGYNNANLALDGGQLLQNINNQRKRWYMPPLGQTSKLNNKLALTVEMETGTGKTYVYIKTIFELHRQYGWSKFIIVVPSIAIREGVEKTFQITSNHFKDMYGTSCRFFIYNSSKLPEISRFSSDSHINVMIINTQAFNARGKDANKIRQELDSFRGRKPIDTIAATRPIVIIDEPQSVIGDKKKANATREALQEFNPLFYLLYSATHREKFNMVYRLDAVDAYQQKLVKRITVTGISLVNQTTATGYLYLDRINTYPNKNPTATVVMEYNTRNSNGQLAKRTRSLTNGDNIFDYSGEIEAYRHGYTITDIDANAGTVSFTGGFELHIGECQGEANADDLRRLQIIETIKAHLQREHELFDRGIKVLSLFFIDEVAKYKTYNDLGSPEPGQYATVFENEYKRLVQEELDRLDTQDSPEWQEYLRQSLTHISKIHAGYFSIDKKGHITDSKTRRGSDESDDESAYDLIMKDKERLLSFEEPVRFIFSHSALREGWDNPNVFQICTLRESSSSIKKRQEIGRGLRLAVNKYGERQDEAALGHDMVQEVNTLTVIANESYDSFAKGLQSELQEVLDSRPKCVDTSLFANLVLLDNNGNSHTISDRQAVIIVGSLYNQGHGIIDSNGKISSNYTSATDDEKKSVVANLLGNDFNNLSDAVVRRLDSVFDPQKENIYTNSRNSITIHVNQRKLHSPEFESFWNEIDNKTYYQIDVNEDKLVEKCKNELSEKLASVPVLTAHVNTGTVEVDSNNDSISMVHESSSTYYNLANHQAYQPIDLIGTIATRTNLTRRTVCNILRQMKPTSFANYRRNPDVFISRAVSIINDTKSPLIAANIHYYKTDDNWSIDDIFNGTLTGQRGIDVVDMSAEMQSNKGLYDYLKYDSEGELTFGKGLERDSNIVLYAKIPTTFKISTPVGNYSPDWAIIAKRPDSDTTNVFFIAETKGSEKDIDLRPVEQAKIDCARKHFAVVSSGKVKYDVVESIDRLEEKLFV